MSEQRLIDVNEFLKWLDVGHLRNPDEICLSEINVKNMIDLQPTIDPETLPIVQQLREELKRVTAERDAAVHDLEKAMSIEWEKGEGDVFEFLCSVCATKECRGICKPKWYGLQEVTNNEQ